MNRMVERVRAEFLEMPGLRLTSPQLGRLCGLDAGACRAVLDALVRDEFLCSKPDGSYARVTDGRPTPAGATISAARDDGDGPRG